MGPIVFTSYVYGIISTESGSIENICEIMLAYAFYVLRIKKTV